MPHDLARVRADFDRFAALGVSGGDCYDDLLLSHVPADADRVLDVGCGLGRLCGALAGRNRRVLGVDVSTAMIERARQECDSPGVEFLSAEFLAHEFGAARFECIITAAAIHHMPLEPAVRKMIELLEPGGTLILHDIRRDAGVVDAVRAHVALGYQALHRLARTGRLRSPRPVRVAWILHSEGEHYLSFAEAEQLAAEHLPGARVFYHSMWRYTIVWHKP